MARRRWGVRNQPNVMFLHFNDLKSDLPGAMRKVAAFLEIPVQEEKWDKTVEKCTFDWMKARRRCALCSKLALLLLLSLKRKLFCNRCRHKAPTGGA
jgi:hypothetical protein